MHSRRVAPQKALRKFDSTVCAMRSPQEGEITGILSLSSVRLAGDMEGCVDPINALSKIALPLERAFAK